MIERLREILERFGYRVTALAESGAPLRPVTMGARKSRQTFASGPAIPAEALTGAIRRLSSEYRWLVSGSLLVLAGFLWGRRRRGRYVRDVMVPRVDTIDSSATIVEAAQRMRDANVGVLPVVEDGRVRGIVTDRDLVVRGLARGIEASSISVGQCATEKTLTANAGWSVDRALSLMAEHQIGRLPVVDDEDRLVGIVTLSSLARRSRAEGRVLDTAKDVSERSARAS